MNIEDGALPKVLIVDDVEENLFIIGLILEDLECEIIKANSGEEALELFQKHEFALLVSDVQMPQMDGYELLKAIHETEDCKTPPAIFVTADNDDKANVLRAYNMGVVDFIYKPIDDHLLCSKAKVFLELYKKEEELQKAKTDAEEARIVADKANYIKGQFLANISHEIRTPLNGMMGFNEFLLDSGLNPEQYDIAKTIKVCSENLLTLVNDILDYSKIEADKIELELIPFNIRELVFEATILTQSRVFGKEIELLTNFDFFEFGVEGDPTRLKQVLINLISNSIKFTKQGEIVVSVSIIEESSSSYIVSFSVKDTGIGMNPEQMGRIFEAYSQADSSTTRKYGGTGLGLPISKNLVELMGGEIHLESEVDKGTDFSFNLELKKVKEIDCILPNLRGQEHDRRCLIINEKDESSNILKSALDEIGLEAELVTTVEEGMAKLESSQFDLIFVDYFLKENDLIFWSEFKKAILFHNSCVIMLSRDSSIDVIRKIKILEFNGYLLKPFWAGSVHKMLHRVLPNAKIEELWNPETKYSETTSKSVSLNILVVEDNKINQKLIVRILKSLGHNVQIANDGIESIKAMEAVKNQLSRNYDVVFMDMEMPRMNGIDATKSIRTMGFKLPIIAMTANVFQEDQEKCIEAGMNKVLCKPIQKEKIVAELQACISLKKKEKMEKIRVMIVEDDENIQKLLRVTLGNQIEHLEIVCESDGMSACIRLGSFSPQIVITDLMMPLMNGFDFINYLRNKPPFDKIKVIVHTAVPKGDPKLNNLLGTNIFKILHKPCNLKEIVTCVSGAIESF